MNGLEDAASDHVPLDPGEPQFDLIEPGRVCRCEVETNPGILLQKIADQGCLVC
jgi:hypothetical protein